MSGYDAAALYALLPAWIRQRDQLEGGGTLRALLGVVATQAQIVADDVDRLYDDQFVETCAPWVLPYIGDLIGFRPLRPIGLGQPAATRAEVADTIGYRRRKGTLSVLEQLALDVTGWPAVAVEYFTRLATTQYVRNHRRPQNAIVDVRSPMTALDIGSAFDVATRSADVRRISSGRGRYNIPNIGLFVWRLRAYSETARPARSIGGNRRTFDPFGRDVPLVSPSAVDKTDFSLTGRFDVPFPLLRYPLYAELEALRAALAAGEPFEPVYFATPPFVVRDAGGVPIEPRHVEICDLTNWSMPARPDIQVAVDPELGRIVFAAPAPLDSDTITVDAAYAFSGDYGGGPYARPVSRDEAILEASLPRTNVASFAANGLAGAPGHVLEIADSGIFLGSATLAPLAGLQVVRAEDRQRPVLHGNLTIQAVPGASVTLRGIGIDGSLSVRGAGPFTLRLEHCTLRGRLDWRRPIAGTLVVDHTLCAAIQAHTSVDVTVNDSIVDAGSDTAAALSGGPGLICGSATIARSTLFGWIHARELPLLENSIVTGVVISERRQAGCVRYSFVRLALGGRFSETPPRFRCQPDLAIDAAVDAARLANPALSTAGRDAIAAGIEAWLVSEFTSRTRGAPGYAQLTDSAPDEIRFGAEDGDEMGAFFGLYGPRRESNLRFRVAEYLRIGLECGIIHAS